MQNFEEVAGVVGTFCDALPHDMKQAICRLPVNMSHDDQMRNFSAIVGLNPMQPMHGWWLAKEVLERVRDIEMELV